MSLEAVPKLWKFWSYKIQKISYNSHKRCRFKSSISICKEQERVFICTHTIAILSKYKGNISILFFTFFYFVLRDRSRKCVYGSISKVCLGND